MVSLHSLFAVGAFAIATLIDARSSLTNVRRQAIPCDREGNAGIRQPANNSVIKYTDSMGAQDVATFNIIYCSSHYLGMSSLNVTALLGSNRSGQLLGAAAPKPAAPDLYIFNVTVFPEDGDYVVGARQLSIMEWKTSAKSLASSWTGLIHAQVLRTHTAMSSRP